VVATAVEISYSVEELIAAEEELTAAVHEEVSSLVGAGRSEDSKLGKDHNSLATRVVRDLVRQISKTKQWQGPLPPVRISPP
jgi:hypothetical protein